MVYISWRDHCRPIIAQVLKDTQGQDEKAIKKALYDAYPYGERAMHPYKIWCDEIKRQRGERASQKAARLQAQATAEGQEEMLL